MDSVLADTELIETELIEAELIETDLDPSDTDPLLDLEQGPDGNLLLPEIPLDPQLIQLQRDGCNFVGQIIASIEGRIFDSFYDIMKKGRPSLSEEDLGVLVGEQMTTTSRGLIKCLERLTVEFYNNAYYALQYDKLGQPEKISFVFRDIIKEIKQMAELGGYEPHVLLDKLFRLDVDIHFDILRENLNAITKENLCLTLASQMNLFLTDFPVFKFFAKGEDDEIAFTFRDPMIPDDAPFHLEIEMSTESTKACEAS